MMLSLATFTSFALVFAAHVHAYVYVTNPVQSSACSGGQSCDVEWTDNGETPLLSQIGECNVALYTGEYQLVQSLPSVDVSTTSSFSFTPDPAVGDNGQYYIVFSSTTISYTSFSGSFSLSGMTGTGGSSSTSPTATPSASSSSPSGSSSSTSTGSSVSTPSGSSTSGTDSTTPTVSPSSVGSSTSTGTTPTTTATTPTTSRTSTTTSSTTTTSPSTTPSNAAARVGSSSTSLGGVAALLVLSGVLAF